MAWLLVWPLVWPLALFIGSYQTCVARPKMPDCLRQLISATEFEPLASRKFLYSHFDLIPDGLDAQSNPVHAIKILFQYLTLNEQMLLVMQFGLGGNGERTIVSIARELECDVAYITKVVRRAIYRLRQIPSFSEDLLDPEALISNSEIHSDTQLILFKAGYFVFDDLTRVPSAKLLRTLGILGKKIFPVREALAKRGMYILDEEPPLTVEQLRAMKPEELLNCRIHALGLEAKTERALNFNQIFTISELVSEKPARLFRILKSSEVSLSEIGKKITAIGLSLSK